MRTMQKYLAGLVANDDNARVLVYHSLRTMKSGHTSPVTIASTNGKRYVSDLSNIAQVIARDYCDAHPYKNVLVAIGSSANRCWRVGYLKIAEGALLLNDPRNEPVWLHSAPVSTSREQGETIADLIARLYGLTHEVAA
ncbi:hypothetical protein QH494_02660 [Sphingomonas sp. AR_OL41]|nr:hypothetical protein [Sphingomonas sp. AR_OL41]